MLKHVLVLYSFSRLINIPLYHRSHLFIHWLFVHHLLIDTCCFCLWLLCTMPTRTWVCTCPSEFLLSLWWGIYLRSRIAELYGNLFIDFSWGNTLLVFTVTIPFYIPTRNTEYHFCVFWFLFFPCFLLPDTCFKKLMVKLSSWRLPSDR